MQEIADTAQFAFRLVGSFATLGFDGLFFTGAIGVATGIGRTGLRLP